MYTTVSQSGSGVISTGFTPFHFTVTDGQTYVVSVSNYGTTVFNHWQDGGTSSTRTITAAGSPIDLAAVYDTG
jgi:hypothetical protein